jgi:hypothetical protein
VTPPSRLSANAGALLLHRDEDAPRCFPHADHLEARLAEQPCPAFAVTREDAGLGAEQDAAGGGGSGRHLLAFGGIAGRFDARRAVGEQDAPAHRQHHAARRGAERADFTGGKPRDGCQGTAAIPPAEPVLGGEEEGFSDSQRGLHLDAGEGFEIRAERRGIAQRRR